MKYPRVVELLEKFIEHHEEIKLCHNDEELCKLMGIEDGEMDYSLDPYYYIKSGLCKLIFSTSGTHMKFETYEEALKLKYKLFKSWEHYTMDDVYPVAGKAEYDSIKNIADNPLRLDLAKHLLKGFKECKD